ncbi:MAG: peptidylprolyl isomerase [Bacteroidales bacterium]|nr:peptidylprolyl isomerase [Bacteroidales bacterium]
MKKSVTGIIIILAIASSFVSCSSCSSFRKNVSETEMDDSTKLALEMERKLREEPEFEIVTTHGTMKIRLYGKTPRHRDNFIKLVSEGYYDGIRFHRVIEGFMIQTGDPNSRDTSKVDSWGMGGPDYTIPAEFVNEYWHKKGAIAAARKGDMANPRKASSGSQFYIVHDENACLHLDGQYTIFGEVTEGLDIIDRIASVPVDRYDRPYEDVMILSVRPLNVEPEVIDETCDTTSALLSDSVEGDVAGSGENE